MNVDVGSFFNSDIKRNPKIEVYIKNVRRKLKLFPFLSKDKDFLSEDGISRAFDLDIRRKHPYTLSHGRPRKGLFHRREHDMINMEDPEILDVMRKSTIPPSLSLRAPPANIALGGRREKVIGITNVDASERYITKLQQDRERNNQALYRCLDNLPIKIKKMTKTDSLSYTDMEFARDQASQRLRQPDKSESPLKTYDLNRNCRSLGSLSSPPKSSKSQSTVQSKFSNKTLNRLSMKKPPKKKYLDALDPRIFGFQYDFDSMEHSISIGAYNKMALPYVPSAGFNGYPIKGKSNGKSTGHSRMISGHNNNNEETMSPKYNKISDQNQQVHFVFSSLSTKTKTKINQPLPPILSEKRHGNESADLYAISSVQKSNDPEKGKSQYSKDHIPDKYLNARYQDSPGIGPLVPMHSFNTGTPMSKASPYKTVTRHSPKSDTSSEKSNRSRCDSIDDDQLKVSVSKSVLQLRDNMDKNISYDSEASDFGHEDEVVIQPLSETALKQHLGTSKSGNESKEICNLTNISEREDTNLTMTTTHSDQLQQMKILIHYKSNEVDEIQERSEVSDSFTVPAWVSDAETDKEDNEKTDIDHSIKKDVMSKRNDGIVINRNTEPDQNSSSKRKLPAENNTTRMNESDVTKRVVAENITTRMNESDVTKRVPAENNTTRMNESDVTKRVPAENNTNRMNESDVTKREIKESHPKEESITTNKSNLSVYNMNTTHENDEDSKYSRELQLVNNQNHSKTNTFDERISKDFKSESFIKNDTKSESINEKAEYLEQTMGSNLVKNDDKWQSGEKVENSSLSESTDKSKDMNIGIKSENDSTNTNNMFDVDECDCDATVFLTAPVDDKPTYSFQTNNPKYTKSDNKTSIGFENIHNVSMIHQSRTDAELQSELSNDRRNTNLL